MTSKPRVIDVTSIDNGNNKNDVIVYVDDVTSNLNNADENHNTEDEQEEHNIEDNVICQSGVTIGDDVENHRHRRCSIHYECDHVIEIPCSQNPSSYDIKDSTNLSSNSDVDNNDSNNNSDDNNNNNNGDDKDTKTSTDDYSEKKISTKTVLPSKEPYNIAETKTTRKLEQLQALTNEDCASVTDECHEAYSPNNPAIDYLNNSTCSMPNEKICRICLDNIDECEMIAPCKCSGSTKYAHESCLLKWFFKSSKKSCEVCLGNVNVMPMGYKPVQQVSLSRFASFYHLLCLKLYLKCNEFSN